MKKLFTIFLYLVIGSQILQGQVLESKVVYELSSRNYNTVPDSTINGDYVDINPFKFNYNEEQFTTIIAGLFSKYRIDIKISAEDTIGVITTYLYKIKKIKPNREERRMFPKFKVTKKEWVLQTKANPIPDSIINSILSIIVNVDFEALPSYKTMKEELGFIQIHGIAYTFQIPKDKKVINYYTGSSYMNKHEKLKELCPIGDVILNYIKTAGNLEIQYESNACYNGGSHMWMCR